MSHLHLASCILGIFNNSSIVENSHTSVIALFLKIKKMSA